MHKCSEVIHTNQRHSFLTTEYGFVPVSQLTLGMQVLNADGTVETVTGWKVVPGTQVMYNLEVAQDHTYTVGAGQWVVHNCAYGGNNPFAQRGNQFHYDMQNGGPAQLQRQYTELCVKAESGILNWHSVVSQKNQEDTHDSRVRQ